MQFSKYSAVNWSMQSSHDEVGNIPWLIYDESGDGVRLIYGVSSSCIQFICEEIDSSGWPVYYGVDSTTHSIYCLNLCN